MKQPKRLTRKQKIILSNHNMDAKQYVVSVDDADGFCVVHKNDHSKEYIFEYTGHHGARLVYSPDEKD